MLIGLVERARAGDSAAFRELVDLHADRCFAIAVRILRDRDSARDAVQRALVSVWRDLPGLRDPNRFEAWLHRVLMRACHQERRSMRAWVQRVQPIDVDPADRTDFTRAVDHRDALDRAFAQLSLDHRTVVVLHHHAGLPLAAISDVLGVSVGTVKSRLHYAMQGLRASIEADNRIEIPEGRPA